MRVIIAIILGIAALALTAHYGDAFAPPIPAGTPQCWTVHDGLNHPCQSRGELRNPIEWRITDKQGVDSDCWRLVMRPVHLDPGVDDATFTDCNDKATYDHYNVGDTYWAPDSITMLRG